MDAVTAAAREVGVCRTVSFVKNRWRCATVFHAACWEREVEKAMEIFCDNFCRWPNDCASEEELQEQHCEKDCPVLRLLNAGL